jgi:hypothetical protein
MGEEEGANMATSDPDDWFESAPASQRPILDALRKLIKSSVSGVVEEIKWSRPIYSTSDGMFCYLHRTKNHVTLGFHQGTSLKDPKNLLEGTGKGMRHVKITAVDGIDQPALRQLIKQASKLK